MAKKFLVWKDRNCNGVNPEWLSLTGEEFFKFIKKEENKDRHFIKMPPIDKGEDEIIIESTEEQLKEEKRKQNRSYYLKQRNEGYKTVSAQVQDENELDEYDKNFGGEESIEETVERVMMIGDLHDALAMLDKDELKIIKLYYFNEDVTERFAAEILGISQPAFHKKMKKIIEKLKKLVIKS